MYMVWHAILAYGFLYFVIRFAPGLFSMNYTVDQLRARNAMLIRAKKSDSLFFLFFGHSNLSKKSKQTAFINITRQRML